MAKFACEKKLICDGDCDTCQRVHEYLGTGAGCDDCLHTDRHDHEYPCSACCNNMLDNFRMKKDEVYSSVGTFDETMEDTRTAVLRQAIGIDKDRSAVYGKPERNFEKIACLWNDWIEARGGRFICLPEDVAVMMSLLKIARMSGDSYHEDNYIDAANYIALAADMAARDANLEA